MRHKNWRWAVFWVFAWVHLRAAFGEETTHADTNSTSLNNDNPNDMHGIFSPRMDYDQWKPLGRGDPLKNDPTYDYVPPVLDRVHYWIDPALRKPDPPVPGENQKTEILLLGVSSKKPSTGTSAADSRKDTYDSFLKFVDGPKFNHHQRISRPHFSSFFPSSPFFPKNKSQFTRTNEQRVPYTMLMPPPMVTKNPNSPTTLPIQKPVTPMAILTSSVKSTPATTTVPPTSSSTASTPSRITIQESNLVYQSSSLGGLNEWTSTSLTPNPYSTKKVKPFKDDVVFQKHLKPPESYIQIQFAPHSQNSDSLTNRPLIAANSDQNINYVTAPPLITTQEQEIMHKGHVSDDNLDMSNTYVKIGKTEAQMHPTAIDNIQVLPPEVVVRQPSRMSPNMMVFSHVKHPMITQTPLTLQTIQGMQTMQPPPLTTTPVFKKTTNLLINTPEKTSPEASTTEATTTPGYTTSMTTAFPTTTTTSLTTDPLFKHYKQPAEPLRGPLYLIIQGHSKVKTYGPSKQIHGIRVQETNEISDENDFRVRHLNNYARDDEESSPRKGRSGDLQTLKHVIQTGLGAIDFSQVSRRQDGDVKEAELQFGYEVADEKDVPSEKYHKGIVEAARKLKQAA